MHTKLPNINFLQKLVIFCCLIFEEFEKQVSKLGVLWPIAWEGVIKMFIWFSKIVPLRAPRFSKDSKMEESIYPYRLTTNNDHQSFWNPRCSKLGNIFIFFCTEIYSFLEVSTKFMMTKISETQVPSFHAYADIKQCLHISKEHENIHDQKDK